MSEEGDYYFQFQPADSAEIIYPHRKVEPKLVAQYMLGDRIGDGSYSKVKEALDTITLERRAIKIMKRQRLRKIPNGEQNVKKELELLRKLNHKNVIKLIDTIICDEKEKLYIVMEYCYMVLQELTELAPGHKFPIWQTHRYFTQILDGLEYLHSQGVVHNDIKPGNLLVNSMNVVKIIDFGVSQLLDQFQDSDYCEHSIGTPAFQPPEIAQGEDRFHGFKVDVWAAGVTLFKFVTGYFPFDGENVYILLENISKAELKIPNNLEDHLQSLLRGMLERDANRRFSIADAKKHHWVQRNYPKSGADEVKLMDYKRNHPEPMLCFIERMYGRDSNAPSEFEEDTTNISDSTFHQREVWRHTKLTDDQVPEVIERANSTEAPSGTIFLNPTRRSDPSPRHTYDNVKERCNQT